MKKINQIISHFQIDGTIGAIKEFGNGHINDTYKIRNADSKKPHYLLQRINNSIFNDVENLMNNMNGVCLHLKTKLIEHGYSQADQRTLTLIPSKGGENYVIIDESYWRVFEFLDLTAKDTAENTNQVYEGAKAFGNFVFMLKDYPLSKLAYVIPNFHNMTYRMNQFDQALKNTKMDLSKLSQEIKLVQKYINSMCLFEDLKKKKVIPKRVVHHDTKLNNVLFSKYDKGICVIDLDTVMPGMVHSDFGDGLRTSAATAGEEETDLTKIGIDIEKFSAFTEGYLETTRDILTDGEKQYLIDSVLLFPFMQGVRFLTDYLNGNSYYKTTYEDQNRNRALNQFQLFKDINSKKNDLAKIISNNLP